MNRIVLLPIVFLFVVQSGHGQICEDVASHGNFYIQQNSSFCVNCPVSGSSVQWTIELVRVEDFSPPLNYTIFPNNSLLMRSTEVGGYRCQDAQSSSHRFIVVLAVDMPPFINEPTVYNETDNVRIICQSSAAPSPIRISWQRDDVEVSSSPLLAFSSIHRSNASVYTCCAVREFDGEQLTTCSNFTITVQYPPVISSSPPANSLVALGTDHMIWCAFEGVPTPTAVWSRDGNELTKSSSGITIVTGDSSSTLNITMVTTNDIGNYTCMVTNLLGSVTASSTLQLPSSSATETSGLTRGLIILLNILATISIIVM